MSNDTSTHPSSTESHRVLAGNGELDLDAVFDVLSHPQRRHALTYLIEEGAVPIDDLYKHLASEVASSESGTDGRFRVEAAFYHCHRPKLEATGLIEVDEDEQVVRPTGAAINLKPHLELSA
jgi:DNA-binding transcriptional ArsR family regulator